MPSGRWLALRAIVMGTPRVNPWLLPVEYGACTIKIHGVGNGDAVGPIHRDTTRPTEHGRSQIFDHVRIFGPRVATRAADDTYRGGDVRTGSVNEEIAAAILGGLGKTLEQLRAGGTLIYRSARGRRLGGEQHDAAVTLRRRARVRDCECTGVEDGDIRRHFFGIGYNRRRRGRVRGRVDFHFGVPRVRNVKVPHAIRFDACRIYEAGQLSYHTSGGRIEDEDIVIPVVGTKRRASRRLRHRAFAAPQPIAEPSIAKLRSRRDTPNWWPASAS
jgi:hypothetical protein